MKKIDKSNKPVKILPGYHILPDKVPSKYTARFLTDTLNALRFNPLEEIIKIAQDPEEMGSNRLKAMIKVMDLLREDTRDENAEVVNFMISIEKNYDENEEVKINA